MHVEDLEEEEEQQQHEEGDEEEDGGEEGKGNDEASTQQRISRQLIALASFLWWRVWTSARQKKSCSGLFASAGTVCFIFLFAVLLSLCVNMWIFLQWMEAFAEHAKRKQINPADVLLCVRRNPDLHARLMKEHPDSVAVSKKRTRKRVANAEPDE